jgi:hypothetical protein
MKRSCDSPRPPIGYGSTRISKCFECLFSLGRIVQVCSTQLGYRDLGSISTRKAPQPHTVLLEMALGEDCKRSIWGSQLISIMSVPVTSTRIVFVVNCNTPGRVCTSLVEITQLTSDQRRFSQRKLFKHTEAGGVLTEVGRKYNTTQAQVTPSRLQIAQSDTVFPVPGTTKP